MRKQFLEIGKIVATQGIRGEVRVQYYCDSAEVLCDFDTLYLDKGKTPMEITRAFPHKNVVVMRFAGIDKIEQAQPLIGKVLYLILCANGCILRHFGKPRRTVKRFDVLFAFFRFDVFHQDTSLISHCL